MATGNNLDCSLSVHLSRALDEIGFNEETVRSRRRHALLQEKLYTLLKKFVLKKNITCHIFGSSSEGTKTLGLHADCDFVIVDDNANVIQDWNEWQPGKKNLLMLLEDTAPCYCRLQVLLPDVPLPLEHLPNEDYTYDQQKRVILKNSLMHVVDAKCEHNGPAHTVVDSSIPDGADLVFALSCSYWPLNASQFVRRPRRGNWPPQSLIRKAQKEGVFLVAVGHKLSLTPELEWRISFSKTERQLMFSMNSTQLKCYFILKMLIKCFVVPDVRDSITSYHCKTAVFHSIEDTSADLWREENLVECIVQCLRLMLTWVTNMFCPHFITPDNNLFAGKITAENQPRVHHILTDLEQKIVQFLCRIPIDKLGCKLQSRLNSPSASIDVDLHKTVEEICYFKAENACMISKLFQSLLLLDKMQDAKQKIEFYQQMVSILHIYESEESNVYYKQAIKTVHKYVNLLQGSLMAAVSISNGRGLTRKSKALINKGDKTNIASLLKLASIFYCSEATLIAEAVLTRADDRYRKYSISPLCSCNCKRYSCTLQFAHQVYAVADDNLCSFLFADCVKFSQQERHCAPPALRHEFDRAIGDDMAHRDPVTDDWMALAAVDSLPFLRFLQYLTYGKVGKRDQQKVALQQLEQCLKDNNDYTHTETGWNLLGQCMEQEKQPESAMRCYRTSLEIRPRNNAANWHIQNLRYQGTKKGESVL